MRPAGCFRRLLAFGLVLAATAIADTPEAGEYELKAAMLANVIRLVEWPPAKTVDSAAALTVCVSSADMVTALERTVAKAPMAGSRRMVLRKIDTAAALDPATNTTMRTCDAVFFGGTDRKKIEAVLRAAGSQAVLTVGENDRFTAWGGIVALLIRDDHLEVEVNLAAAEKAGLTISSRLLRIAVIRRQGSE